MFQKSQKCLCHKEDNISCGIFISSANNLPHYYTLAHNDVVADTVTDLHTHTPSHTLTLRHMFFYGSCAKYSIVKSRNPATFFYHIFLWPQGSSIWLLSLLQFFQICQLLWSTTPLPAASHPLFVATYRPPPGCVPFN